MKYTYFFEWAQINEKPIFSFKPTLKDVEWKRTITIYKKDAFVDLPKGIAHCEVILQTNIKPLRKEQEYKNHLPLIEREYCVPLLKSSLQKSVRRRLADTAVRLAYQLIYQDLESFLRRLPVIIAEDAVLHPYFPNILWWMMACSKGWQLSGKDIALLLEIVYQIAETKYHDVIPPHKKLHLPNPLLNPVKWEEVFDNDNYRTLIACFILRASYGGMKGDIQFLQAFAGRWSERFLLDGNIWNENIQIVYEIPPVNISAYLSAPFRLLHEDKIMEGIDFHCFPFMIEEIKKSYPYFSSKEIQSAIWHHRSGLYTKYYICTHQDYLQAKLDTEYQIEKESNTQKIWKEIEECVELLSENIAAKSYGWKGKKMKKLALITHYFEPLQNE